MELQNKSSTGEIQNKILNKSFFLKIEPTYTPKINVLAQQIKIMQEF